MTTEKRAWKGRTKETSWEDMNSVQRTLQVFIVVAIIATLYLMCVALYPLLQPFCAGAPTAIWCG